MAEAGNLMMAGLGDIHDKAFALKEGKLVLAGKMVVRGEWTRAALTAEIAEHQKALADLRTLLAEYDRQSAMAGRTPLAKGGGVAKGS